MLTASALADLPHFATTNAVLAAAVFALTIWILVVPDSAWGGPSTRAVMALGVTLCPTDPEVFGVLLYSFWWASLWPLIIFGWTQPHWRARVPLLAVAALSSPAAGALFVLFAAYGWMHRRRHDVVSAAILATGLLVEFILALTSGRASNTSHDPVDITTQLARTFGVFVWPWPRGEERHWVRLAFLGVVVLVLLAVLLVRAGPPVRLPAAALAAACLIYAGFSALPNPLMTDPRDAGPRYFFLPFTALIWLLIHLAAAVGHNARIRLAAALIALSALLGAFPVLHRAERYRTAHLNWADEIGRCAASTAQEVDVPIYFDGSKRFFLPPLLLTPEDCRAHS